MPISKQEGEMTEKRKSQPEIDEAVELEEDDLAGVAGGPAYLKLGDIDGESKNLSIDSYKIGDIGGKTLDGSSYKIGADILLKR